MARHSTQSSNFDPRTAPARMSAALNALAVVGLLAYVVGKATGYIP